MTIRSGNRIKSNALIVFTREPEPGKTKTRLMPYYSPDQCADLHRCMLKDISREMRKADADIIVVYTCGDISKESEEPEILHRIMGGSTSFISQRGEGIGERMQNAIGDVLALGYEKAVLIGTDIPELEAGSVDTAFSMLDDFDVVMGPTEDGGYYLIGMKAIHPEAFNVKTYGVATVFEETCAFLESAGLSVGKIKAYADLDVPEDLTGFRRRMKTDIHLRRMHTGRFLADNTRLSVIVPVYNEAAEIGRLIRQLKPYRNECEIIIVDGGSTDNTIELLSKGAGTSLLSIDECGKIADEAELQDPDIRAGKIMLLRTDKGRAIQMNAGANVSTGDILFFLHCDSILPDHFISEIRRVTASHDWGCFGIQFQSRNFFMHTNRIISNHRALMRRLPFGDQGIFIERDLFLRTGMFPEIALMEDYEFSMRMRRQKGVKGPGMTRRRLVSSTRRYGSGTAGILRTELCMWKLRRMYRHGASTEILQKYYGDIR